MQESKVYEFPVHNLICSNCEHAYMGAHGVFCGEYREEVLDEAVAAECNEFSPY